MKIKMISKWKKNKICKVGTTFRVVPTINYIYGIGGRDTKIDDIKKVYTDLQEIANSGKVTNPYRYLGLRGEF